MKNPKLIAIIAVLIVLGGGSFYAGMKYQESKAQSVARQFGDGQHQSGTGQFQNRNRSGFRPVAGEIIGSDDKSITVKLADGSSKIVLLSEKTEINKADKANVVDLKAGEKVAVFGTENSDGSISAQNIQLNPQLRMTGGSRD
ncbi:hypothetical protein A2960_00270 [Candidatus Gottesmanbacteria bacterium RIFCSPLOWO2_01_FULL_39_12b]|uniref:Uncharacterized protein n=1 Tax=Candidatus Gottesmanbacteria bacterium RIFCSPLOWO2_01_FULL_39_12b TaxID=1798388 RepID=A0A1F6ARE0_9BACT|nr:MAG: hypothetical protein A2960_00270 [Candidatus Gottesmanbacteria bacterium RIFCSPLOWO2_01_FULL_39_12b]